MKNMTIDAVDMRSTDTVQIRIRFPASKIPRSLREKIIKGCTGSDLLQALAALEALSEHLHGIEAKNTMNGLEDFGG